MILVMQRVLDALSVGSTYALLALGLTLVYSVMNLINFAYGMMLVWSAFVAIILVNANIPAPLVILGCIVFSAALSVVVGRLAFQPFLTAPPVTLLITSFGVELVLQYVAILFFGENPRILQVPPVFNMVLHVGGIRLPVSELTTIGTAVVVFGLLYLILNRTNFGMQIRAAAELPDMARLMGVSPATVLTAVFAISGIIAGLVGVPGEQVRFGEQPQRGVAPWAPGRFLGEAEGRVGHHPLRAAGTHARPQLGPPRIEGGCTGGRLALERRGVDGDEAAEADGDVLDREDHWM